ncbi:MAG: TlpA family protein disulfide reductase [Hyphomicrobiaceae bacterium]
MSTEQRTSWTTYAVIAGISAVVGFAAIYVIVGGNGNGTGQQISSRGESAKLAQSQGKRSETTESDDKSGKLNVGKMTTFVFKDSPAPVPEAKFNNGSGAPMTLADFKGKVVLVNLWATWCAPCRKEMPDLDRLQAELGSDRFEVVAVSVDRGSPEKSRKFLDEINAKALKLYHDPSAQLSFTLKTIGMPSTLLIDADGRELGRLVGPAEWDSADAKRLIRAQLQ